MISYNAAISACGACGEWHKALEILTGMRSPGSTVKPDVISYSAAITACEKGGEWQRALGVLGE